MSLASPPELSLFVCVCVWLFEFNFQLELAMNPAWTVCTVTGPGRSASPFFFIFCFLRFDIQSFSIKVIRSE